MKKITRFLFCTFVAIMLMGTAISATACHQKEEYPSVPEVTEPQPTGEIIPTVDRQKELKDARKKYSDAVAWLYMPGAEVDDPIVQAKDNAYYLQKDENGNYSEWGCYYAHCDNRLSSRSKLDRNTVIFGHSASNCDPDGPKLTKLHRYMDADYVKENPYIYLSVKGENNVHTDALVAVHKSVVGDERIAEPCALFLLGRIELLPVKAGKGVLQCGIQQGFIPDTDTAACFLGDELVEQQHLIFRKLDHFASFINAGLYFFRMRAATTSIFSSSVISIMGDTSRSTSIYLGLLFLKITACPFFSAMRVTREKF